MRKLALILLAGCAAQTVDDTGPTGPTDSPTTDCAYPDGAVEPMALDEVIHPYRWPDARSRRDGAQVGLDLADVPCNTDPEIDWSPHEVLLFVSIPAW